MHFLNKMLAGPWPLFFAWVIGSTFSTAHPQLDDSISNNVANKQSLGLLFNPVINAPILLDSRVKDPIVNHVLSNQQIIQNPKVLTNQQIRKICGYSSVTQTRIVGGVEAALNAWPWMVTFIMSHYLISGEKWCIRATIFLDGKYDNVACGGVLINQQYILTAAHCVTYPETESKRNVKEFIIRLGEQDIMKTDDGANPVDFGVESLTSHPDYNAKAVSNDIGILKLNKIVNFTKSIIPICLPETKEMIKSLYLNDRPYIAGWGSQFYRGKTSEELRQVSVRVIANNKCKDVFKKFKLPITEKQMCAGYDLGGKDACQGDSGGPLMMTDENNQMNVIGVVSVGYKCAEPGYPGIYTKTSAYLDWIKTTSGID